MDETAFGRSHQLFRDLTASLVVFLVAVPLSMGIALASGAPIASGLIAAAVGGIVVGLLSGAPLQVSGPAAGLVVIVFGDLEQFGFGVFGAIVVAAGALQIALGAAGVARVALAISPAVIHGMLAGIGVQIALAQLHVLLGGAPESSAIQNVAQLPEQVATLHTPSALLGVATLVLLLLWPRLPSRLPKFLPAPLVAVAAATGAALLLNLDVSRVELPRDLKSAFSLPEWPMDVWQQAALAAATLAFVASAESLLCAVATDKLHGGPRANLDRELIAQGVGNVCSGLAGGLPVTGVIVRSTANISAGARTRLSAILHGLWVVLFVTLLGSVLTLIPLAVLAALLVSVGAKLVDPRPVKEFARHKEASTYFVTLVGVLAINLLAGIGLGVAWSLFRLLRKRTQVSIDVEQVGERTRVVARGALTFVGVPKLSAALAAIPERQEVDLDLDAEMVDHAAFEALHAWKTSYEKTGGRVDLHLRHEPWPGQPSDANASRVRDAAAPG
jgi:carbonic anhydrase